MDDEAIRRYFDDRYDPALGFYDSRAAMYKSWYRRLSVFVILVSAVLTPFVALVPSEFGWRIASATMSASLVVATGLLAHYKCHENWLSYRAAWDALKREREFHATGILDYATATDPHALFVERVEAILAREGREFYARHREADQRPKSGATTE